MRDGVKEDEGNELVVKLDLVFKELVNIALEGIKLWLWMLSGVNAEADCLLELLVDL
jgi:hypothetical protein